jgi:hypothetical protein
VDVSHTANFYVDVLTKGASYTTASGQNYFTPTVAAVKLNVATSPSMGVSGVSYVNLAGYGFPSAPIVPRNASLAAACGGGSSAATTAVSVISIVGTSRRIQFQVPSSLYYRNRATAPKLRSSRAHKV